MRVRARAILKRDGHKKKVRSDRRQSYKRRTTRSDLCQQIMLNKASMIM